MAKAILITKPEGETSAKYWYPAETTENWQTCPSFGIHLPFAQSLIADPKTLIQFVEVNADGSTNVLETLKEPA